MAWTRPRAKPYEKMTRLLKSYDLDTGAALGAAIGKGKDTGLSRFKNPADITLGELKMLNQRAHIPLEEIREAISW